MRTFLLFCIFVCLKRRKQSVNINNIYNMFQILLSGVLQGSILGPLRFNIFINDLFYYIKDAQLLNFADDNKIAAFSNSVDDLTTDLQKESENAIDSNEMVVNPDKFKSIIINRGLVN